LGLDVPCLDQEVNALGSDIPRLRQLASSFLPLPSRCRLSGFRRKGVARLPAKLLSPLRETGTVASARERTSIKRVTARYIGVPSTRLAARHHERHRRLSLSEQRLAEVPGLPLTLQQDERLDPADLGGEAVALGSRPAKSRFGGRRVPREHPRPASRDS